MLQWMGGSRRKVTTSRMSTQKRQKQYFEQRKRQQHYRLQTDGLEDHTDGVDMVGKHLKEHRSLDVLGLLNLSTIARECKSACPSEGDEDVITGRDDSVVSASAMENDIIMDLQEVLPSSFAPANSVGYEEAKAEITFPKKDPSSASDNQNNGLGGIKSKPDWGRRAAEQRFSVFDLLEDDGLDGNGEDNPVDEAHVAFSVEGLGKVGTETPVCSPQRTSRTFAYGFSSPLESKQQAKSSKNINSLLEDLEFEGDKLMLDVNDPFNGSSSEFSNCLTSQKQKSFTDRDGRKNDDLTSKISSYFSGRNLVNKDENSDEDKWNSRFGSSFQDTSFFYEGEHDVPWKSYQRRIDDDSACNFMYENDRKSEGIFEGPWMPLRRTAAKATDMFDIQEPTTSSSMWQASEYMHERPISTRTRLPTDRSEFNFRSLASGEPDRFCFVSDDARDNLSLQSQESCSSSAVRGQGADNSLIKLKSRQSRNHCDAFADSRDKSVSKKTFRRETRHECKDDILLGRTTGRSKKSGSLCNRSKSKSSCPSHSLFREEMGRKDISFFDEGSREDDTNPDPITFQQSLGMKHPSFGSKIWNEDHFSAFAEETLHFGQNSTYNQSGLCEPAEFSPPGSYVSKKFTVHDSSPFTNPDFHTHYESKRLDSPRVAGSCSETPSSDASAQESFSKDVEYRAKTQPPCSEKYQPEEEIYNESGGIFFENKGVKNDPNLRDNPHESMGMNDTTSPLMESVERKTSLLDHAEERPRSSGNPVRYENLYNEKEDYQDESLTCQDWEKETTDFSSEGKKSANTDKTDHVYTPCQVMMFQSYVFQLLCVQNVLQKSST